MMTREEHLAWAKTRALQYLPDDPTQALASMASDLRKHGELADHVGLELGAMMMFAGLLSCADQVQHYIEGFN